MQKKLASLGTNTYNKTDATMKIEVIEGAPSTFKYDSAALTLIPSFHAFYDTQRRDPTCKAPTAYDGLHSLCVQMIFVDWHANYSPITTGPSTKVNNFTYCLPRH